MLFRSKYSIEKEIKEFNSKFYNNKKIIISMDCDENIDFYNSDRIAEFSNLKFFKLPYKVESLIEFLYSDF